MTIKINMKAVNLVKQAESHNVPIDQLQALLNWAIREKDNSNINISAPARNSDFGYFRTGFSPVNNGVSYSKHLGVDAQGNNVYDTENSVIAPNGHLAYIEILKREINAIQSI